MKDHKCVGFVFKGYINTFFSDGRLEQRSRLSILKRKSCMGCYSNWLKEELDLYASEGFELKIKDGVEYELIISGGGRCSYSGEYNDIELNWREIKEPKCPTP